MKLYETKNNRLNSSFTSGASEMRIEIRPKIICKNTKQREK